MPTHQKPRVVPNVRCAPTQKGRIIRRRHTRSHLKVWEYFHKKPHIQLPAHSFYENNEWFLYFSLILCRFYPRQRGGESLVVASFHLRLFAIGEARASAADGGFIPAEALLSPRRPRPPPWPVVPAPHFTLPKPATRQFDLYALDAARIVNRLTSALNTKANVTALLNAVSQC